jgi:hypothetical protein
MQKSFRSAALAIAFASALTVVPGALAAQTGCNPHPQLTTLPSTLQIVAYTVASILGL